MARILGGKMLSRAFVALCLCGAIWSCSGSNGGSGGVTDPGPLVDNTKWVPSEQGAEFFGARPEGAVCELTPMNCDEYYPWPEGECVEFEEGSTCVAAFVPECYDPFTVLAVYTRMENDQVPLCGWITLEQPSLRAVRAGDQVEIRVQHSRLTAPVPGSARMGFVIGDQQALDYEVSIPSDDVFPDIPIWTAPKDYPAGTSLLFHVDNHGANEYLLVEVNVL